MTTVLIIEDYSDSRELLSALLRAKGYNVTEAEDGEKGLLEAERRSPDLILMDLAMPVMNGVEATRKIRQLPGLSRTPIFAASAYVTDEVKADAMAAGCTQVFGKPVNIQVFLEKIEEALGAGAAAPSGHGEAK